MNLKLIFIAPLLWASSAAAQKPQVKYEIEMAGKDSFYLVETVIRPIAGASRPQELKTPVFFPDTLSFVAYIREMKQDYDKRELELKTKADEAAFLAAKIRVIEEQARKAGIKMQ